MDLNYLYKRHQIALFMAENGSCARVRQVHGDFADLYAARITDTRQARTHLQAA
jgi:hypothetical protein